MKPKTKRIWYAVQENKSDGWDGIGSYDFRTAAEMLKSQGYGLIAAVDEENQFCVNEYPKCRIGGNMKKIIGNVMFAIICIWLVYATASYIDILAHNLTEGSDISAWNVVKILEKIN